MVQHQSVSSLRLIRVIHSRGIWNSFLRKKPMKIEPKPMSAERRAEILAYINDTPAYMEHYWLDLLADAAYWREAVMRIEPAHADECCVCKFKFGDAVSVTGAEHHKPYCAWLRAQS